MKRKAFTLIELLVVIALIGLLAMIIGPAFANVMAIGRATICRNNLGRLGEAFGTSSAARLTKEAKRSMQDEKGAYPGPMMWPTVPSDTVDDIRIYKCPEDEIVQASVAGSLKNVEYVSPYGHYPLDTIGNGNCYKSRRGRDAKGPYTEYIMQDDEGTGGQYAQMNFNGWIDTDGGARVYDSGFILIFNNLTVQTEGCVPDWSGAHGIGWPTGINTCGNQNDIWYMGQPSLEGDGRMQSARGNTYRFPNFGLRITNYGINSRAYKYPFGGDVVVLVDYLETIVNVDQPGDAEELLVQSARHSGKVNYLKADGSVLTARPLKISPRLQPKAWAP